MKGKSFIDKAVMHSMLLTCKLKVQILSDPIARMRENGSDTKSRFTLCPACHCQSKIKAVDHENYRRHSIRFLQVKGL